MSNTAETSTAPMQIICINESGSLNANMPIMQGRMRPAVAKIEFKTMVPPFNDFMPQKLPIARKVPEQAAIKIEVALQPEKFFVHTSVTAANAAASVLFKAI